MLNTITVPKPCSQNWDNMQDVKEGKFCSSCEKTVHDLTRLSDEELILFLHEKGKGVCGKFRNEQLTPAPKKSSFHSHFRLRAAAIGAFILSRFFFSNEAKAQDNNSTHPDPVRQKMVENDSVVYHINGNVHYEYNFDMTVQKSYIPAVKVFVKAGRQLVELGMTNSEGYFELNVTAKRDEKTELVFRKTGYDDIRVKNLVPSNTAIEIKMNRNKHWRPAIYHTMGCPSF
ncbi:MAG TPA: hypothetical protein VI112_00995 [Bacteroidia bacterium]|jgi:hypothetical protein